MWKKRPKSWQRSHILQQLLGASTGPKCAPWLARKSGRRGPAAGAGSRASCARYDATLRATGAPRAYWFREGGGMGAQVTQTFSRAEHERLSVQDISAVLDGRARGPGADGGAAAERVPRELARKLHQSLRPCTAPGKAMARGDSGEDARGGAQTRAAADPTALVPQLLKAVERLKAPARPARPAPRCCVSRSAPRHPVRGPALALTCRNGSRGATARRARSRCGVRERLLHPRRRQRGMRGTQWQCSGH